MKVAILSPDKPIYEGDAKVLTLPGLDGLFQILDHHAPLVAALGEGIVKVDGADEGHTLRFEIQNGFVEVLDNVVSLLVTGVKDI